MNEMESLYDEYKRLRDELSEKNLDEVGVFELRNYRRRFESLHRRNLELQRNSRLSLDVDEEELRQVLNLGDRMWRELGDTIAPVVEVINIKMAFVKQISDERLHIKSLKEENLRTLKTLMNQNRKFKKTVEGMTDPGLRAIFEDKLKVDEETIQKLKDLDKSYESKITELSEKLKTIALGGILSELESTKKDSEGLSREEAEKLTNDVVSAANEKIEGVEDLENEYKMNNSVNPEGLPGVGFDDIDSNTPVDSVTPITASDDFTDGLDDGTTEEPVPVFPGTDYGEEEPVSRLNDGEEDPVPGLNDGDEDPVPGLGDGEEDPIPGLGDGEEDSVPGLGDEEEEEEEETPVRATVKQPKSKLWQKIQIVLEGAKAFLLTAIAIHTSLIIGANNNQKVESNSNTDIVEESQNEVSAETDNKTETSEQTETSTQTEISNQTQNSQHVDTSVSTPVDTSTQPSESKEEDKTTNPTLNVEKNEVILNPGESVYDSKTGVEVGYTGNAVQETNNGYVQQEDRELEQTNNNTVVVKQEDLQPDPVKTELPRTGQEVTEDEARQDMTQGEQSNLDEAIGDIDWEAFFNDGPTL